VVLCGGWVCVGVCVCVWCGVVWCVCVCVVVAESVCGYAHLFVGVNVSFRVDRKDIFGYVSACTSLSRRVSVTACGFMCVCVCVSVGGGIMWECFHVQHAPLFFSATCI